MTRQRLGPREPGRQGIKCPRIEVSKLWDPPLIQPCLNFISRRGRQADRRPGHESTVRLYPRLSTMVPTSRQLKEASRGQQRPTEDTPAPFLLAAPGRGRGHGHEQSSSRAEHEHEGRNPTQGGNGVWACGLAGLLKAQGARLERRGEAPNLQKPPREELKPQARWRAKGRECVRENTPVLFHNPSVVGASQSPPKTCGCAALEGQYCNSARAEPA